MASIVHSRSLTEVRRQRLARFLIWPATLWLILFFVAPLVIVVLYSFLTPDPSVQIRLPFNINNYVRLTQTTYTSVVWRSLWTAILTTLVSALFGYPLAWFIATRSKRVRNFFLLLVVIP